MSAKTTHSLGHRTATGFAWLFGQTIAEKVLQLVGQIVLAWVLAPDHFQLVALVYTVTTFAGLLQTAGLREVLIQRHTGFHLWANAIFWMSLTIGLAAGIATALAAPLVAGFYHRPEMVGLLLVAAALLPLNALVTVSEAEMRAEMRFRFLAFAGLSATALTLAMSVGLALLGFGAYSFLVPPVIVAALKAIVYCTAAPPPLRWRPQVRRWRYLIASSAPLLVASIALMVTYQGSTIILGKMYPALTEAAIFYFAWNLSDQSLRLLVNNLSGVLFPALNTLADDPGRQMDAFLRAARSLLIVGLPICLAQAVLSGPIIRLAFEPKWEPAIPVMTAISVGMTARLVFGPVESILLAQRRQRAYMLVALVYAALFIAAVYAGARWDRAIGAAIGAGACLLLLAVAALRVAVAPARRGWGAVLHVYTLPVLAGLAAFGPGAWLVTRFRPTIAGDVAALLVVGATTCAAYGALIYLFARPLCDDLLQRLLALVRPPSASPPPSAPPRLQGAAPPSGPSRSPAPAAPR